jgi:hypothetical protein
MKTLIFFRLKPNDGIEPYLGAMGHCWLPAPI